MNDKSPADLILCVGQFEAMNGFAAEWQFVEGFGEFILCQLQQKSKSAQARVGATFSRQKFLAVVKTSHEIRGAETEKYHSRIRHIFERHNSGA